MLDKDEIKNSLSLEQIENLVANLGGEPHRQDNTLICRTICHGGNSQERFMKIINKNEFKKLIEEYPDGGIVFAEYSPDIINSEIMVTDGDFGATCIIPHHGEVFNFDWNIEEYNMVDLFIIFDNADILQMIQILTSGLKIKLKDYYE